MAQALAISGGGIRGILPCCALIELERQTGKLVRDCFDYFSGTSTGSDLVALIQAGVPMTKALTFYTGADAKKVFDPQSPLLAWPKRVIEGYIYEPAVLATCLRNALGDPAAAWAINDCPKGILIVGCDSGGHPWFFVKDGPKNSRVTGSCNLVDATIASSAAPTYFQFYPVNVAGVIRPMCDGGTCGFANPVFQMAVEMFYYDDYDPAATQIVSLGTGFFPPPPNPPAPKGLIDTISFAVDTLLDSAEDLAAKYVRIVYSACKFQTLNPTLTSNISMDSLTSVPELVKIGQAFAKGIDWKGILNIK